MSNFQSVVTEQKVFICAVHAFIVKLIQAVLPDVAWDNTFLCTEEEFSSSLDAIIQKHDPKESCEGDCRLAMAQTACRKMKKLCDLLKQVSASVGLRDVANQYLDAPWFIDLLLRMDVAKLNRLYYLTDFDDEKPSRILMNVAAILDGRDVNYDNLKAKAKRKADSETKELIKEVGKKVESLHGKMDSHSTETKKRFAALCQELHETKDEVLAKANAIIKKLSGMNLGGKRNGKHTVEQKKVCLSCWMSAQENVELKSGTKTGKATIPAAFNWYRKQLAMVGVATPAKFKSVLHTLQSATSASNIKALEAKREAERKAKSKTKPCSQFINYGHVKQKKRS